MVSPVLLITNFSTASGAYGLSVNGNSSSTPTIGGGNSGSGTGFRGISVGGIGAQGLHTDHRQRRCTRGGAVERR
jgi:hypothetical protein